MSGTPELPPLGEKTASVILGLLQDLYRQEVGAEEDVHRTLPFFATALGLIVASLNYSATQLPSWSVVVGACSAAEPPVLTWSVVPCAWSALLAGACLVIVMCLSVAVLVFLGRATRKRGCMRIGPEPNIIDGTRQIHAHYVGQGAVDVDTLVVVSVREQPLEPLARAAASNREATQERYHFRALAVSCLLWSLFFALLAATLIVVTAKFGVIKASL
jgi:hypothetical protein